MLPYFSEFIFLPLARVVHAALLLLSVAAIDPSPSSECVGDQRAIGSAERSRRAGEEGSWTVSEQRKSDRSKILEKIFNSKTG